MALEGHLSDMSLIDLLQVFWSSRRTGRLLLTGTSQRAMLWFLDGRTVNAAIVDACNKPVSRGEEAVFDLLQWEDASFKFLACASGERYVTVINRSTDWLILEGLRRRDQQAAPAIARLELQSRLELVPKLDTHEESVSLSLEEWRILSQLTETTTVEQLAATTGYPTSQTLIIVGRLVAMGVLRVYTPSPLPPVSPVAAPAVAQAPAAAQPSGLMNIIRSIKTRLSRIGVQEQPGWQTTRL